LFATRFVRDLLFNANMPHRMPLPSRVRSFFAAEFNSLEPIFVIKILRVFCDRNNKTARSDDSRFLYRVWRHGRTVLCIVWKHVRRCLFNPSARRCHVYFSPVAHRDFAVFSGFADSYTIPKNGTLVMFTRRSLIFTSGSRRIVSSSLDR